MARIIKRSAKENKESEKQNASKMILRMRKYKYLASASDVFKKQGHGRGRQPRRYVRKEI